MADSTQEGASNGAVNNNKVPDIKPKTVSFNKNKDEATIEFHMKEEGVKLAGADLALAAAFIQDAVNGRNMDIKTDQKTISLYEIYNHWLLQIGLFIFIWLNLALALFEKPAVDGLEMPYWATMILELVCLAFFVFRLVHSKMVLQDGKFFKDSKNIVVIVLIGLTLLDMVVYLFWVNFAPNANPVRWSRPLRAFYIINFAEGRQIRRAFRNIRRTLPDIMNVLILFIFSVALFALLAFKMFDKKHLVYPDGKPYFRDYWESFWDLYVLVTTANNPDVMMPAYENSSWFALFFVIYTIICLYIFMSIVLAVIYNNYKRHLKGEVKLSVFLKRRLLRRAFDILKIWKNGQFVIPKDRWDDLMRIICPNRSQAQLDLLLMVLDTNGDTDIEKRDFLNLVDLLNVELTEVRDRMTLMETHCAPCYMSTPSEFIKKAIHHRFFMYFFDFMILVNAICMGFKWDVLELYFFLPLFTLEIVLKLYAYGPKQFFSDFWNIFDFIVVGAALIGTIIEAIQKEDKEIDYVLILRVLRLIRIMGAIERFKVIITTIMNIGPSIITYGGVIFVLYYFYAIIGMESFGGRIRFYGYNNLKPEQQFCGDAKLNGTEFFNKHYCKNNFNDILKSFVLLFELMVVNQWHILTSGFVAVTNKAARLYFISFHLACVIIVLNIFTAFVLEVFILEFSLSGGKFDSAIEEKITEMGMQIDSGGPKVKTSKHKKQDKEELVADVQDVAVTEDPTKEPPKIDLTSQDLSHFDLNANAENLTTWFNNLTQEEKDKDLKFHLKKKSGKNIELLLQRMFEGEIDPDDEGEDENLEQLPPPPSNFKSLTLDSVA
ncbi:unnamed protein product [Owenia fusiformis]|uniref:Uncharacterized protein n=1 Tax=Owenia fusiformis TaxID=6347 RepID=A0A8J1U4B4_OWEFU|nr:unnamed protein product [Owenia fusiformis]